MQRELENIRKYVFMMPFVGLFVSLILFVYFFGVVGVEEPIWLGALYCALPFLINMIIYFPLCLYYKSSISKDECSGQRNGKEA